jgi:hypothetical protein
MQCAHALHTLGAHYTHLHAKRKTRPTPSARLLGLSLENRNTEDNMELTDELKAEIDFILNEQLKGNACSNNKENSELRKQSIRICEALNLIKLSASGKQYELSEKAIIVFNDRGIEKYLFNIGSEKDLDLTIKQLTGKRLKYDILYNIIYVLFGGLIAVISTLVEPDNAKEYIKEIHKQASDKVVRDDSFQKRLNDKNIEVLSLKKKIDSLKNLP